MGQGSDTVMAQIAAEVLNIDPRSIRVIHPDTDVTPYDMGTLGSRSTFHMGTAVRLAAEDANRRIEELARELGMPPGRNVPLSELFRAKIWDAGGQHHRHRRASFPVMKSPIPRPGILTKVTPFWGVGATGAEVEVDVETGQFDDRALDQCGRCRRRIEPGSGARAACRAPASCNSASRSRKT